MPTLQEHMKDKRMRELIQLYAKDRHNANNNEIAEMLDWLDKRLRKLELRWQDII